MLDTTTLHITSRIEQLRYQRHAADACKYMKKNAKVLDLGCGIGHFDVMLKQMRPDIEITALDLLEREEWKAFESFGINFIVGDALKTNFDNASFDVIISSGLMEHLDNNIFFREVTRLLKPDGYNIVINIPNKYGLSENVSRWIGMVKIIPGELEQRYTKQFLVKVFTENNFNIVSFRREGLLPAQYTFGRTFMNKIAKLIVWLDNRINWLPLSQSFIVVIKVKNDGKC